MPLVRIDMRKRPDPSIAKKIGAVIYASLKSTINVPDRDNFQIITEHDENHFVYDPTYLDIPRTDALIYIQITLNEGRTLELKKSLYYSITEGLHQAIGQRPEDVFISLIEVKKENWSFGHGLAQYAL